MKKTSPVLPDMNVTPLVDVVLVLLIIFMVVAPRMDQDVQVELPGIFNPDPEMENQVDPLKISLASDGTIYLDQEKYDLDAAVEALGWKYAENPQRRLVIRADRRLKYGQVRAVLAKTQKVGFPGSSLIVGEKSRPAAAEPEAGEGDARRAEPVAAPEGAAGQG